MKTHYISIVFIFVFQSFAFSQVQNMEVIGQTPGGGGYHVHWDETAQKLIVGCGTSLWIYDMSNPHQPQIISKRPILGLINETEVYGNVLFVAATHDGIYALDYSSPDLDIIAHYDMKQMGDTAAYDLWRSNDTLFVADYFNVRVLKFNQLTGFSLLEKFGGPKSFCVSRRGQYIVVGNHTVPLVSDGNISVYHINNLNTPLAVWSSPWLNWVMDVQFADLSDDILYVCGGPETGLFLRSNFFAFNFDGSLLTPIDTFSVDSGLPGYAQMNIMNMDSRNDTLYLVTTAAWMPHTLPLTYMQILDATGLPSDSLKKIGKVTPGFWHFDAALMDGTPYIAMSSEWLGVMISDISQFAFADSLCLLPTGGWCGNNKIHNDLLWACHTGYGMIGYNIDSLLFTNGFWNQSIKMHIHDLNHHYFSTDLEFLNDSLMIINTSEVYNIKPWLNGGNPVIAWDINKPSIIKMYSIQTNTGQRMVTTNSALLFGKWLEVFNPFDSISGFPSLYTDSIKNNITALAVSNDTIYYGKSEGNNRFLVACKIENDIITILDSVQLTMPWGFLSFSDIHGISVEDGEIAVAYGPQFALFRWNGNTMSELFVYHQFKQAAIDVVLKNKNIYIADKNYGFNIYNVASLTQADHVAQGRGTGGWMNPFGTTSISIAPDGKIFLSDFHAGVIIYEAYDTTLQSIPAHSIVNSNQLLINIFPNPSGGQVNIFTGIPCLISIFDLSGKIVFSGNPDGETKTYDLSFLRSGVYILKATDCSGRMAISKLIISNKAIY